jgi:predicted kinase
MLIAMAGLPGSGKSALARALATRLPAVILDKDPIRAALFPPDEIEYSTQQDDFCIAVMLQVAGYVLGKDPAKYVVLDGRPFARSYQRLAVVQFAATRELPLRFIECVCSDAAARRRLAQDVAASRHVACNRNYDLYVRLKACWEPLQEERLIIDTEAPLDACIAQCLAFVSR